MEIAIEKVGGKIWLRSPYHPEVVRRCKLISGGKWNPDDRVWQYPLDWDTCLELRKAFGKRLKVGIELAAWAREAKARMEELMSIASQSSVDLALVSEISPVLAEAMANRTYQQVGAAWLAKNGAGLLGDQPGLGKTLQAIGAVIESEITGPIIVFAPNTAAQLTWPPELNIWVPDDAVYLAAGQSRQEREMAISEAREPTNGTRRWLLCNVEMARLRGSKPADASYPELFTHEWASIIVDESHRGLICHSAKTTSQSLQRRGLGKLKLADGGIRMALSGTPFRGKPENLWGTLNWLRPDVYTSYWKWVDRWFEVMDNGFGKVILGIREEKEDQFHESLRSIMLRRTKAEVVKDLPAKLYAGEPLNQNDENSPVGIWIPIDGKQAKAYKDMFDHAAAAIDGGSVIATGVLAEMVRLKQFAISCGRVNGMMEFEPALPSNKLDYIIEWLAERGIAPGDEEHGDTKVVICSQFTQIINLFANELERMGIPCLRITGQVKGKDRAAAKESFQGKGGPRVIFLNTMAGGVSLTLDKADDLLFIDETWIPDDQEQVEDRIHRVSRIHQVTIYYLRSRDTIDEQICRVTESRENIQKMIMDGSRGVEFAKKVLSA